MAAVLQPSHVSGRDGRGATIGFTAISVVVAIAMFLAASGSGSGDFVADPPPDWLNIGGNVFSVVIGLLVLVPRTRALGAILATGNMFVSMYLNHRYDGVDYFVDLIPFNTVTIMLASILIGHYVADLPRLFRRGDPNPPTPPGQAA
ncbi:MAG: hypothetical protein AAGA90_01005 [Actinomycetota bacterium]